MRYALALSLAPGGVVAGDGMAAACAASEIVWEREAWGLAGPQDAERRAVCGCFAAAVEADCAGDAACLARAEAGFALPLKDFLRLTAPGAAASDEEGRAARGAIFILQSGALCREAREGDGS